MSPTRESLTVTISHVHCQGFRGHGVGCKVKSITLASKKRRPTCFVVSGSEYVLSDQPGGPAKLRETKKEKIGKKVDSSQINRNERDEARRKAIHLDQVQYESMKADSDEWLEVLKSLEVLGHRRYLSEKVICNYTLDHWWDVRFSPGKRPIYLLFSMVHWLSLDIVAGKVKRTESFDSGEFGSLYRSVASRPEDKRVCFFLFRSQSAMNERVRDRLRGTSANHFFPVVFDYTAQKAYSFGVASVEKVEVRVERGGESPWSCWLGPELWVSIAHEMGWGEDVGDVDAVCTVEKNWQQVWMAFCSLV